MSAIEFCFPNHEGHILVGSLEMPDTEVKGCAIFAHCFTCSKDFVASRNIARAMAEKGLATLRFDFTGLGNSSGDFANSGFQSNVEDIISAAEALKEKYLAPCILIGHSLGGAAVLAAAAYIDSTLGIVTIGAPFDPAHVLHQFGDTLDQIEQQGHAEVKLGGVMFSVNKEFLLRTEAQQQLRHIASLRCALLVMHDPMDDTVGIANAKMIFDAARHPKSFFSLEEMGHLLRKKQDAHHVATVISSWAERYVGKEPRRARIKALSSRGDKALRAVNNEFMPYGCTIEAGEHRLFVDEPLHVGGQNTGATPFDLLKGALATCTMITLQMYAERKKWSLGKTTVDVFHEKGADEVNYFRREIVFENKNLDQAQRAKLLEIAEKCPVHRTIEGAAEIITIEV